MGYGMLLFDHFLKVYLITLYKWEIKLIAFFFVEMGLSYAYVPTLPEPYRSNAPVLSHGTPGTMFMSRMDPPFSDLSCYF